MKLNKLSYICSGFIIAIFLTGQKSVAQNVSVIDVRKNIPRFPKDPVIRDYFLNAGSNAGLKRGMLITVTRRVSVHDSFQNKSQGELYVPVGKLKIVQVQAQVSVGRLVTLFSRENLPNLEIDTVISGDRLDLASAEDESQKSYKLEAKNSGGAEPEPAEKEKPLPPSANDGSLVRLPQKSAGEPPVNEPGNGPGLY